MKVAPARAAAFDVLYQIDVNRALSSVLLPAAEASLSKQDKALCHEIVLGTLRRQLYLDRVIAALTKGKSIDPEVRIALRLALYQIKFLDRIPAHTAVNESVNLVARARKSSAKAFVNGVLRSFLRGQPEISFYDDIERLSVETSHPRWLIEKWAADHGVEKAGALARSNNQPPQAAFRFTGTIREIEPAMSARQSDYVRGCFIADPSAGSLSDLANEGLVYMQDEASQMVASLINVGEGESLLDVCSSPGGKMAIIAENASANAGALIAGDITQRRVRLLKDTLARRNTSVTGIVRYDAARTLPFEPGFFDHVFVDAPCSGTGTIRHNPEIRYFVEPDSFAAFSNKQLEILVSASQVLRPGGSLIYSTCSIEPEENEGVIERFLASNDGFSPEKSRVPERFLTAAGFGRTWPDRDNMDGFFVAELRRNC
jgi:16S rRNA (cytosine967-C5)-methyltransferase